MASTYAAGLRARLDLRHQKAFGQRGFYLPEEVHEAHFQQELTGGFNKKRDGVCESCFMVRTATGTCNCE